MTEPRRFKKTSKRLHSRTKRASSKKRVSSKPSVVVEMPKVRIPARFARRMTKQWKKTGWGVDVLPGPGYFLVQAMSRTGRAMELRLYPDSDGANVKILPILMDDDVTQKDLNTVMSMAHQIVWTESKGIEANG